MPETVLVNGNAYSLLKLLGKGQRRVFLPGADGGRAAGRG